MPPLHLAVRVDFQHRRGAPQIVAMLAVRLPLVVRYNRPARVFGDDRTVGNLDFEVWPLCTMLSEDVPQGRPVQRPAVRQNHRKLWRKVRHQMVKCTGLRHAAVPRLYLGVDSLDFVEVEIRVTHGSRPWLPPASAIPRRAVSATLKQCPTV